MKTRSRGLVAGPLLAIIAAASVVGCNSIPLRTAAAPATACDMALASGTLTNNRPDGLALRVADGSIERVLWPFGYSSRGFVGSMELVGPTGAAIAREGDSVQMGGGVNGDGIFVVCAGTVAKVAPPT